MQDFLKQWGPAIITAVAILAIIAMLSGLTPTIQGGFSGLITNFGEKQTMNFAEILGDAADNGYQSGNNTPSIEQPTTPPVIDTGIEDAGGQNVNYIQPSTTELEAIKTAVFKDGYGSAYFVFTNSDRNAMTNAGFKYIVVTFKNGTNVLGLANCKVEFAIGSWNYKGVSLGTIYYDHYAIIAKTAQDFRMYGIKSDSTAVSLANDFGYSYGHDPKAFMWQHDTSYTGCVAVPVGTNAPDLANLNLHLCYAYNSTTFGQSKGMGLYLHNASQPMGSGSKDPIIIFNQKRIIQ